MGRLQYEGMILGQSDTERVEAPYKAKFVIKDSGTREQFASGMQRDTAIGKSDPSLIFDGPMLRRWIAHLDAGAKKYDKRNWMKATGQEELDRFRESALRHFVQWWYGERDEDHAAAVIFNLNGAEYVRDQLADPS
jgi:hypothetical protein